MTCVTLGARGGLRRALKRFDHPGLIRLRLAVHQEASTLALALPGRTAEGPWPGFGEPFNGQQVRLRTIRSLIAEHVPDVFLETGTFFGFTTRFFVGQGAPVYSVEIKRSYHAAARMRLGVAPELCLRRGHSLDTVAEVRAQGFKRPFAYLDAHWYADLPLGQEVADLLADNGDVLVVVDDIRVPHDDGYAYDEYEGVPLSLDMLRLPLGARAALPAVPASEETGARRGTLYLAQGDRAIAALNTVIAAGLLQAA